MSDDEIEYAVKNYSKLYSQKGKEMFTVYDGIYDALRELKKSGFKLAIATQKHRMFTTDILETYERRMFSTQYVQQMSVQTSQRVICFCRRVSRQEFPLKKYPCRRQHNRGKGCGRNRYGLPRCAIWLGL